MGVEYNEGYNDGKGDPSMIDEKQLKRWRSMLNDTFERIDWGNDDMAMLYTIADLAVQELVDDAATMTAAKARVQTERQAHLEHTFFRSVLGGAHCTTDPGWDPT